MTEKLKIKTAHISYKGKGDEIVINTTIKSAEGIGETFAPTWDMVMSSKRGKISWEEYTARYIKLMRQRFAEKNHAFGVAVRFQDIVLTCYCADKSENGRTCHRYLLEDILTKVAESMEIEVERGGEVR